MASSMFTFVVGCFALLSSASAQTFTSCNPLNSTDCPLDTALGMSYNFNFTQSSNASVWNTTAGTVNYGSNGAEFTINKQGDSPTIQSEFYIFFGTVEVHMKAASGQGVISSIVLLSDDLDEVDWEFIGGNDTTVETNYFGKDNTTAFDRAIYYPVTTPMEDYHNYTTYWTSEKIEWYIDTVLVRTLLYADANGGNNFPQTPMTVRLGIWAGGDPSNSNGTIEWAGGLTDYTKGPYTMYVMSAKITDGTTGAQYQYSDTTGSYKSIKTIAGNSTIEQKLTAVPTVTLSMADKWAALSSTAKIGVYAGASALGASLLALFSFCCIRQRRRGKRENDAYLAKLEAERKETEEYQIELKGRSADSLPSPSMTPAEYKSGAASPSVSSTVLPAYTGGGFNSPRAYANRPTTPGTPGTPRSPVGAVPSGASVSREFYAPGGAYQSVSGGGAQGGRIENGSCAGLGNNSYPAGRGGNAYSPRQDRF